MRFSTNWTGQTGKASMSERTASLPSIQVCSAKCCCLRCCEEFAVPARLNMPLSIPLISCGWSPGRTIDHTTISEFRRRNLEEIRKLHKRMLRYAMDLGLAKLSELCLDGTRIRANANRYKTWTVKRLEKLLADVQNQLMRLWRRWRPMTVWTIC